MQPISPRENMAVFVSRAVKDGQYVALAVNSPVTTAGVLLAHFLHAPDMRLGALCYLTNFGFASFEEDLSQVAEPKMSRYAEAILTLDVAMDMVPRMDWCFFGAMQVDKYGNVNLIGIRDDAWGMRVRGPGSVGSSTVAAVVQRSIIQVSRHTAQTLVETCDFVSAVGWGTGGAEARARLGLPGGGPAYVVTPMAVLDFEEESKCMRLKHVVPGCSIDEIAENTGFDLVIPAHIEEWPEPEPEEISVLRNAVDIRGVLRNN